MAVQQLFGIIPTGCPILTNPTSAPTTTSFIFALPIRPFSHIVVFLLPGITLPPDTAAAVYFALSTSPSIASNLSFKFLGAIGPGKESAIFKVNNYGLNNDASMDRNMSGREVGMVASEGSTSVAGQGPGRDMILGISIEPSSSVAAQMASLSINHYSNSVLSDDSSSGALVAARPQQQQPNTLQLAERIIRNAFNFLASFSGNVPVPGATGTAGVEVVPLKAFEDWWKKFEGRVRSDPGFLERESD